MLIVAAVASSLRARKRQERAQLEADARRPVAEVRAVADGIPFVPRAGKNQHDHPAA
jgi:hypothetical protein